MQAMLDNLGGITCWAEHETDIIFGEVMMLQRVSCVAQSGYRMSEGLCNDTLCNRWA